MDRPLPRSTTENTGVVRNNLCRRVCRIQRLSCLSGELARFWAPAIAMAMAMARARGSIIARAAAGISSARHRRANATSIHDYDIFGKMKEASGRVAIDALSEESFSVDQVEYFDSIICLSKYVLSWTPKTFEEITPESLSIVDLLTPTPEIVVIGTGNVTKFPSKEVKEFLRSRNIKIESVDSRHAAIAFNFMNVECRDVIAAMLPCGKEVERTVPF